MQIKSFNGKTPAKQIPIEIILKKEQCKSSIMYDLDEDGIVTMFYFCGSDWDRIAIKHSQLIQGNSLKTIRSLGSPCNSFNKSINNNSYGFPCFIGNLLTPNTTRSRKRPTYIGLESRCLFCEDINNNCVGNPKVIKKLLSCLLLFLGGSSLHLRFIYAYASHPFYHYGAMQ